MKHNGVTGCQQKLVDVIVLIEQLVKIDEIFSVGFMKMLRGPYIPLLPTFFVVVLVLAPTI